MQDIKTGQFYAIKAFSKTYVQDKTNGVKSLMDEITKCRGFSHKNIVKFEEYHETENSVYLVFEYLAGDPIITEVSKLPKRLSEIRDMMESMLKGVKYLKEQNIVHKDLKPYNIIFKDNRDPSSLRIIDFGLSATIGDNRSLNKVCGTPGFMGPELFDDKLEVQQNAKLDIFSLGVIFYCLIFRKFLFDGETASEIYHCNAKAQYKLKSYEDVKNDILDGMQSEEAYDLLVKMLQKDPAQRISIEEALSHCFFESEDELDFAIPADPVSLASTYLGESNSRSPVLISEVTKKFDMLEKKETANREIKRLGLFGRAERKMTGETRAE